MSEVPEAQDEYDSYVGGVYRLLASGASEEEIIGHLYRIESDTMGMPAADREGLRGVAGKLTKLREPKWNNLRSEPRFIDLMKRMRLEL